MAKKLLIFLTLFAIILGADESLFKDFDSKFYHSNKSIKIGFHEKLKDAYVKALVQDDNDLKVKSLSRLIKSSKSLGLDYQGYQNDLNRLKVTANRQTTKPKESKQVTEKKLFLLSAAKKDDFLELRFNQDITGIPLRQFSLGTKPIRNVIDIEAILNGKSLTYKNFLVDEIRIAQFDKSKIRIVFADKSKKNINIKTDKNKLLLSTSAIKHSKSANKTIAKSKKADTTKPKKIDKVIVIDAGHGGNDPGAIGGSGKNRRYEKVAVLAVANKLGKKLEKLGYKIYYTRTSDKFINLRSRTKFANDKNADLFISIHANAAPNAKSAKDLRGVETFFLSPARSERSKNAAALENKSDIEEMNFFSKQTFLNFLNREKIIASNKLGIDVQTQLLTNIRKNGYKVVDGGVREAPFWVLVGALMPAVLVEIGYITHPIEGKLLYDKKYQEILAQGIAKGVNDYFSKNR